LASIGGENRDGLKHGRACFASRGASVEDAIAQVGAQADARSVPVRDYLLKSRLGECASMRVPLPANQLSRSVEHAPPDASTPRARHCFHPASGYSPPEFWRVHRRPRFSGERKVFTPAFAQGLGGGGGGTTDIIVQLVPFALILVIMYFLIMRPQQKRAKEHADLIKNLRRGDSVITSGGLIGKVTKVVDDAEVELEIAPNVRVRIVRTLITDVRAKGEPVKSEPANTQDPKPQR
jgi:preprotein translocase subunit YajC